MCKFCEKLESWKENHENPGCNKKIIYGCMLYMYMKGRKSSLTSRPHDLNYCPECGKKISAGE